MYVAAEMNTEIVLKTLGGRMRADFVEEMIFKLTFRGSVEGKGREVKGTAQGRADFGRGSVLVHVCMHSLSMGMQTCGSGVGEEVAEGAVVRV